MMLNLRSVGMALALVAAGSFGVWMKATSDPDMPRVSDWRRVSLSGHVLGSPSAPVRIVEFADFQCEFCRDAETKLRSLRMYFHDSVAIVYRHLPVTSAHKWAFAAALAAECAGQQGHFEEFHNTLYFDQKAIGVIPWGDFATRSGVPDLRRFDECIRSNSGEASIHEDQMAAGRLHIPGTPTLLVNGWIFVGMPKQQLLRRYVRKAMDEARSTGMDDWHTLVPATLAAVSTETTRTGK